MEGKFGGVVIFLHVCRSAGGSYAPAWEIRKATDSPPTASVGDQGGGQSNF